MTHKQSNAIEGHIDQIINARWFAMGLSQTDLAEVLGLAFREPDDTATNGAGRAAQIAHALDVATTREERELSSPSNALQSLLALRLLRAFHALTDQAAKEVVVQLAEQMVKRQINRR
jgi:hypothetical protein